MTGAELVLFVWGVGFLAMMVLLIAGIAWAVRADRAATARRRTSVGQAVSDTWRSDTTDALTEILEPHRRRAQLRVLEGGRDVGRGSVA